MAVPQVAATPNRRIQPPAEFGDLKKPQEPYVKTLQLTATFERLGPLIRYFWLSLQVVGEFHR